jgi:Cu-Zn family superoxide dismutase
MKLVTAALLALSAGSNLAAADPAPATAHADLHDAKGAEIGQATLTQFPNGVLVHVQLAGLPPGPHGFHVHAVGKCEPPFATAGGHFNPDAHHHGMMNPGFHAGDLPNLYVAADGTVTAEAFTTFVSLGDGPTGLFGPAGTALVVHAGPDDYKTDPSGNSGDRIACGVIVK